MQKAQLELETSLLPPDRIQLYSLPTPNGVKASIMLEETGLPYEPRLVRFDGNEQLSPEYFFGLAVAGEAPHGRVVRVDHKARNDVDSDPIGERPLCSPVEQ